MHRLYRRHRPNIIVNKNHQMDMVGHHHENGDVGIRIVALFQATRAREAEARRLGEGRWNESGDDARLVVW